MVTMITQTHSKYLQNIFQKVIFLLFLLIWMVLGEMITLAFGIHLEVHKQVIKEELLKLKKKYPKKKIIFTR